MRKPETIEREIEGLRARIAKNQESTKVCRESIQALTSELRSARKALRKVGGKAPAKARAAGAKKLAPSFDHSPTFSVC